MKNQLIHTIIISTLISSCYCQINSPTTSFNPTPHQSGLSTGAIVGIVVGVIGGTLGIIIGTCCFIRAAFARAGMASSGPAISFSVGSPNVYASYQQPEQDSPYYMYDGPSAPAFEDGQAEQGDNGPQIRFYAGSNPPDWARDAQRRATQQLMDDNRRRMNEERQRSDEAMRRNLRMQEETHRRNMDQLHRNNADMHRNIHQSNMRHQQQMQQHHQSMQRMHQQQNMINQQRMQQNTFRPPGAY